MKKIINIIFILVVTNIAFSGWTQVSTGTTYDFSAVTICNSQLFFATAINPSNYAGVFFKSTNGGLNWSQLSFPANFRYPYGVNFNSNGLTGLVIGSSILMTSNGGENWASLYTPTDTVVFFGVDIRGDNVASMWAVGNRVSGQSISGTVIVRCPNLQISNPVCTRMSLPSNMSSYQLTSVSAIDSMTCYIGVSDYPVFDGVLKTTDKGVSWTQVSTGTGMDIWSIKVERTSGIGFAAGGNNSNCGVYKTTNYGASWNQVFTANTGAIKSIFCGAYIYAVGNNGMILKGNYFGDMWQLQNSGISTDLNSVDALDNNSDIAIAVGDNGKMLMTIDGGIGIKNISTEVPKQFSLMQNYPNPFNPVTIFNIQIAKLSAVRVIVYDIIGREIATLVNEQLGAGTYQVDWDGSSYSSGVYFYKLIAGDFAETKKMILMK